MTNKNITRKQALSIAIDLCKGAGRPDAAETLSKMLEQISKPRKAVVSKARLGNESLAKWVYDHSGDVVTTKDVVNMGNPAILTTQKASAVLRVACELGLFVKGDGKNVAYAKIYGENTEE